MLLSLFLLSLSKKNRPGDKARVASLDWLSRAILKPLLSHHWTSYNSPLLPRLHPIIAPLLWPSSSFSVFPLSLLLSTSCSDKCSCAGTCEKHIVYAHTGGYTCVCPCVLLSLYLPFHAEFITHNLHMQVRITRAVVCWCWPWGVCAWVWWFNDFSGSTHISWCYITTEQVIQALKAPIHTAQNELSIDTGHISGSSILLYVQGLFLTEKTHKQKIYLKGLFQKSRQCTQPWRLHGEITTSPHFTQPWHAIWHDVNIHCYLCRDNCVKSGNFTVQSLCLCTLSNSISIHPLYTCWRSF